MQAQIRPVKHTPFQPAWWLKHAHLQTIFAKYLSPKQLVNTEAEMFSLPDGGWVYVSNAELPRGGAGAVQVGEHLAQLAPEGGVHGVHGLGPVEHQVGNVVGFGECEAA